MFGKKKNTETNVILREYAETKDVAPTPGNVQPDAWPSAHIDVGSNVFGLKKEEENVKREYVPPVKPQAVVKGQSAPGAKQSQDNAAKKKQTLKLIAIIFVFILVVFGVIAVQILPGLNGEGETGLQEQKTTAQTDLEKMKYQQELEAKLAVAQNQRDEALSQIDQKVEEKFKALLANQAPVSVDTTLSEQLKAMAEGQAKMQEQIAAIAAQKKAEELKPREGSPAATISYNRLPEIKETQRVAQAKLDSLVKEEPPFDTRAGLQTGAMIPATLKTTIVSSSKLDQFFVCAETTEPFEIMRGYILPAGVKFLGKSTPDMEARRIIVNVDRLQYKQTEVKVSGMMLDYRGNPGLVTKYVDPLNQAIWPILLTSLASSTASAMQDMTGRINSQTGEYYEQADFSAKNAALEGTANALNNISGMLFQAQMRKQPVIIVKAGIPIIIQISEKLGLDNLIESGVIMPSFN